MRFQPIGANTQLNISGKEISLDSLFPTLAKNFQLMKPRLLNNLPIEDLTSKTDYLGIIEKGDLITTFLESNVAEFDQIKMFALYGEWGSGKSTLMKYLQKELDRTFNTFFFETWEFETDNNLSLSLLQFLLSESETASEQMAGEFVKVASKLFKGFSKSIRVSFPGISIDGKQIVEALEEENDETFLELKKRFKVEFMAFEDNLKAQKRIEYNVVFIDDLDRCEPENVLNLLSAVKLFFTYGKRTIFIFGIDKKAVKEAVKTKYGEIVKANEYLEKIFDISFSMPEKHDVLNLVKQYFQESDIDCVEGLGNWHYEVNKFLSEIGFTNPRRVKKVLNKFQILRVIRSSNTKGTIVGNIPNINLNEGDDSSFFETILTLYFIILHEFKSEFFDRILDLKAKKDNYSKAIQVVKKISTSEISSGLTNISNYAESGILDISFLKISDNLPSFMMALGPVSLKQMHYRSLDSLNYFSHLIPESNTLDYRFFTYLLNNRRIISNCKNLSNISLNGLKEMITQIL